MALQKAGVELKNVVKVNAFVDNESTIDAFNKAYSKFFAMNDNTSPVRSVALGVAHQDLGAMVEVEVIARKNWTGNGFPEKSESPYHPMIQQAGNLYFVSGYTAENADGKFDGDMTAQAKTIFNKVKADMGT